METYSYRQEKPFDNLIGEEVTELLIRMADRYERADFIPGDPISVPHRFSGIQDIEISAFLTATIAWGQRQTTIRNALKLMEMMDHAPHEFITGASLRDLSGFRGFKHRTFNGDDCQFFMASLQRIYREHGSLEKLFQPVNGDISGGIHRFREFFFRDEHFHRTEKHIADPVAGSSAKRINMFLRWMVRSSDRGVDFGIWKSIKPGALYCPLDVHSSKTARHLGLLHRTQNDWKAVAELTSVLRTIDPSDPVRFDFALFGMGVTAKGGRFPNYLPEAPVAGLHS